MQADFSHTALAVILGVRQPHSQGEIGGQIRGQTPIFGKNFQFARV